VRDFIRIMMGLVFLFSATPVFSQDIQVPNPPPQASVEDVKTEDTEIAEIAEMLQLFELLENMELMEDLDILGGEDTNEKKD